MTELTIKLAKPIPAHGEDLHELKLRRPTAKELRLCGGPYRLVNDGVAVDYDACAKLLVLICGIPPSSVDHMDGADFDEAALALVGFIRRAAFAEEPSGSAPKV